jgi:hypothetical protein
MSRSDGYSPTFAQGPGLTLGSADPAGYALPVDGWSWFDSEEAAYGLAARANLTALTDRADAALADLRLIVNSTGTLTGLQLSNAVRVLARADVGLIRLLLLRLDGID